jgi:cytochrome c-type biogenesis protein CcmH
MTFWLFLLVLGIGASYWIFRIRSISGLSDNVAARTYRQQLLEIDQEIAAGHITTADAAAARLETERRLAAALRQDPQDYVITQSPRNFGVGGILMMMGLSLAIYANMGRPDLVPPPQAQSPQEGVGQMIAALEKRVLANPGDAEGWAMLGWAQGKTGQMDKSIQSYEQAVKQAPDDAQFIVGLGEALRAKDGHIGPRAKSLFEQALALSPKMPNARFYLGLAAAEAGDAEGALSQFEVLAAQGGLQPTDQAVLRRHIEALGAKTGRNVEAALKKLDQAVVAPSDDMSRIDGMIAKLAQRLSDQPDDVQGWKMLIKSLSVRQGKDPAREAVTQARTVFKGRSAELSQIDEIVAELGL